MAADRGPEATSGLALLMESVKLEYGMGWARSGDHGNDSAEKLRLLTDRLRQIRHKSGRHGGDAGCSAGLMQSWRRARPKQSSFLGRFLGDPRFKRAANCEHNAGGGARRCCDLYDGHTRHFRRIG